MHFRILLMIPYSSFRSLLSQNIVENYKNVLPKYNRFSAMKKMFQKEDIINSQYAYALSYTALFTIFYGLDLYMTENINRTEILCNDLLRNIDGKIIDGAVLNDITYCDYEALKDKKEKIFSSLKGRLFLYRSSLYIFGGNDFDKIYQEIKRVSENIE